MTLLALGLNHDTAPLALREAVAFTPAQIPTALGSLKELPGLQEGAIVSTCNRTEVYAVADRSEDEAINHWLCRQRNLESTLLTPHLYAHHGRETVRHALRVASGLDSLIVGEPQILGQMKESLRAARNAGSAGPLLTRLFQHSFSVAKLIRTETEIGKHPVSLAYAGVSLMRRIFADFERHSAMLIGAGEMIELTARYLRELGLRRLIFANRTLSRAQALANRHHGFAIPLAEIGTHLSETDIVVSSTASPQPVLTDAQVQASLKSRRHRPVFMLDLAVPRDIESAVGDLNDVYLYTVDDLRDVIEENMQSRRQAADLAESMVDERTDAFLSWLDSRRAADTITELRQGAEDQRDAVLAQAQRMLEQGKPAQEVIEFVGHRLTRRLMHGPSAVLRRADKPEQTELLDGARRLFQLDQDEQDD